MSRDRGASILSCCSHSHRSLPWIGHLLFNPCESCQTNSMAGSVESSNSSMEVLNQKYQSKKLTFMKAVQAIDTTMSKQKIRQYKQC